MDVDSTKTKNKESTESKSQEDLVSEEINPRVLQILGLTDVFDFTYEEYLTLLKEKMVAGRMNDSSIPTEDVEAVTDEYKRVKGKTGKFKIKKTKIDSKKLFGKSSTNEDNAKPIVDASKLLAPTAGFEPEKLKNDDEEKENISKKDELLPIVTEIKDIVIKISESLEKQLEFRKKLSDLSRVESEKSSRSQKEEKLESSGSAIKSIGEKITKPFTSIFDTIKNFLLMTFLGAAANWIFSILQDPKKLLQPIQDLITGITEFFNKILQWIDNNVIQAIRNFVDLIESGINAFIGLVNQALKFIPGSPQLGEVDLPNIPDIPDLKAPNIMGEDNKEEDKEPDLKAPNIMGEDNKEEDKENSQQPSPKIDLKNKGGLVVNLKTSGGQNTQDKKTKNSTAGGQNTQDKKTKNSTVYNNYFSNLIGGIGETGGSVTSKTGMTVSGLGKDTQLTALRNGEFVLVPGAANYLGVSNLESLNKKFGGDNKERYASVGNIKIQKAAGGGRIVTSQMGNRTLPLSPGMHMGVDIHGNVGEKLQAFTDGVVEDVGVDGGYGNYINWIASDGYANFYAHMNKKAFAKKGAKVKKGTILGELGDTGRSTGPHLHWEVSKNPRDTGMSKSAVLSRINPLSKYSKEAPFGGSIMPDPNSAASPEAAPGAPGAPGAPEAAPAEPIDLSKAIMIKGDVRGGMGGGSMSGPGRKEMDLGKLSRSSENKTSLSLGNLMSIMKKDTFSKWSKANPKLSEALIERERTRGTNATTNPLMKSFIPNLPSPVSKDDIESQTSNSSSSPSISSQTSNSSSISSQTSNSSSSPSISSQTSNSSSISSQTSNSSSISSQTSNSSLTPMQQWAKNFPQLAKKVKPGQSGYVEIQKVINNDRVADISKTSSSVNENLVSNIQPQISAKNKPIIPNPPSSPSVAVLPIPSGMNNRSSNSGSISGITGTPAVSFSSENLSEMSHRTAVKSLLNVLE